MLIHLLESAQTGGIHARLGKAFFRQTNEENICRLLDFIMDNKKGAAILREWMRPHAIALVCDQVHDEMEAAKPFLRMTTAETSPDFIESWDINSIMDPVSNNITPVWTAVLTAATEPKQYRVETDNAYFILQTRNIISAQVHYRRSFKSSKVQIGLGLTAWSMGASCNMINILHKAGLSNSYCSISSIIFGLHVFSLQQAEKISAGPHAFAYDNVNFSSSKFVEQRPGAMCKVQSGTFPIIYKLQGVDPLHLKLAPIIANLKNSRPLRLGELQPTQASAISYSHQTAVNIAIILFKCLPELDNISCDPILQHKPRQPLPIGHKTRFFPLSVSTIEEASVTGNLHLTNARIRGTQSLRAKDVNAWERREVFQLAFGTFHLVMNLIWALLHTHCGTAAEHGSLTHYFEILEKAQLGNDRPDYHTLLAALTQILDGLILNAWRSECGFESLDAFAASKPTPADILRIAEVINNKYACPSISTAPTEATSPHVDVVHANTILLTRNLLYVVELISAISAGDFGRIEDILPQIACIFRGAGSNNYSMEVLHLLFNIKHVWTPEFL
ncbi:hypothetical protein B0H34DRAFT_822387 [Crassisporium funariophilum]|nr:hypothetical protein B0H34DRAFT_822387 [Crassisporium funariophilum]